VEHSNWRSLPIGARPPAPAARHPVVANDAAPLSYYAQLEAGARYLARTAPDPAGRAEHLRMADVYRERGLW
jgi:hypothetical protein